MLARPRNVMNPAMSVIVVRTIDDDCAGSWRRLLRMSGTAAPDMPATLIEITIAVPITSARPALWLQAYTATAVTIAHANPLMIPVPASFQMRRGQCVGRIRSEERRV